MKKKYNVIRLYTIPNVIQALEKAVSNATQAKKQRELNKKDKESKAAMQGIETYTREKRFEVPGGRLSPCVEAEHRKRSNKRQTLQWRLISFDMLIVGGLWSLNAYNFQDEQDCKEGRNDGED